MAFSILFAIGCDTASNSQGVSQSQTYTLWITGTVGVNENIPDGKKYNILHSPEQARILRADPEFKEKDLTKDEIIALLKSNGFTNAEANEIFNDIEQGDNILDFNFDNNHYIVVSE